MDTTVNAIKNLIAKLLNDGSTPNDIIAETVPDAINQIPIEKVGSSGDDEGGGSAYKPYKKQRILAEFNGDEVNINDSIGDSFIETMDDTTYFKKFYIGESNFENNDILVTEISIIPADNYEVCIPTFQLFNGSYANSVDEHNITGTRHESYYGQVKLLKGRYNGLEFVENNELFTLGHFNESASSGLVRNFQIIIDVELHKPNQ